MSATGIQPQDVLDCTWTERLNLGNGGGKLAFIYMEWNGPVFALGISFKLSNLMCKCNMNNVHDYTMYTYDCQ